ncbi:unnamed protein product [Brassicogethes aeneus]|uniref:Uncharacterized protein n=1 Tax=Brassicogethes aeneus TaxID=1431903 RepID=A0A9P0ARG8_BRAAE|nr:unnamed protein product [Brassicogethes aeneus]
MEQIVIKKEPEELDVNSGGDISMNYDIPIGTSVDSEIHSTSRISIKQEIKKELKEIEQIVVNKEPEKQVDDSEDDISMNYNKPSTSAVPELPLTTGIAIKQEIKEELYDDEALLNKGILKKKIWNEESDNSDHGDESENFFSCYKKAVRNSDFSEDEDEYMFETKMTVEYHELQYDDMNADGLGTDSEVVNKEVLQKEDKIKSNNVDNIIINQNSRPKCFWVWNRGLSSNLDNAELKKNENEIENQKHFPCSNASFIQNEDKKEMADLLEIKNGKMESESFIDFSKEMDIQSSNETILNENEKVNIVTQDKQTDKLNENKYIRKRDFCYFCKTDVLNFARHVLTRHSMEQDVQKILTTQVNSKERKILFTQLRNKGNYTKNYGGYFKPVRKGMLQDTEYLPCENCLGFFSRKLLFRHKKRCKISSSKAQIKSQNHLLSHIKIDEQLKQEVFPHMRADKVSLEAKKDPLICAFGARYLKTHREKHVISVTSRKMRELSKVLIEVRKMNSAITNLFSALQTKYFDYFVDATKIIAKYDKINRKYEAPTYAINIATLLKQCCDLANQYSTVNSAEAESDLKNMIHLFNLNWSFEVSTEAANTLNTKKWNKVTMIPLATDLQLLKSYLIKVSEAALSNLEQKELNVRAYNNLMESIYCRVILLNRKRPSELQRMMLNTYLSTGNEKQHYEEFYKAFTPAEKVLINNLKLVVIRGKQDRGIPVLFSKDVQTHIQKLLKFRPKYVSNQNVYLFAKANSTNNSIIEDKIIEKFAKSCGAKNPSAITSTRLRKHLATLTQVFSMTENEIEQLAHIIGHTVGVHKNSYMLPDIVYQTAKISKLLILMESGCADQYKGQSLNEIEINLEANLLEDTPESDEECIELPSTSKGVCQELLTKKTRILIPWTDQQKTLVRKFFKNHINKQQAPKRKECEELIARHPNLFKNKSWRKLKVFIQNEYSKKKK